jgi:hypothetical protein
MTDNARDPGRIDLRAIDTPADPLQSGRVIAAVLARMAAEDDATDVLGSVVVYSRPLLAAAAVLLMIAAGTLFLTRGRTQTDQRANMLAAWAQSSHVPTNGELLATFQGYDR